MANSFPASTLGFARHNHRQCIANALAEAERYCEQHKLRFTQVRRRALSILLEHHRAIGAYELLERLDSEGLGSKPPVAYRALAFLVDNGFAHRIEKLNAYIACAHPGEKHAPAFLICNGCGAVAETQLSVMAGKLAQTARNTGFEISHCIMEAEGQCPQCKP